MQNTSLHILGSKTFYQLVKEFDIFANVDFEYHFQVESHKSFLVIFIDNLQKNLIHRYLDLYTPIIIITNNTDTIKKNYKMSNFTVLLKQPIEINNFLEIIKILKSKFQYFQNSEIILKNYILNLNKRVIEKNSKLLKLTELEMKLIIFIKNSKGVTKNMILKNVWRQKNILESHAFETTLHRLRKKIKHRFNDVNFINQKDGMYYLL